MGRTLRARSSLRSLIALALVAATLAACSLGRSASRDFARAGEVLPMGALVAVLPFENLTNYPNAGQIAADLLSTELYGLGLYQVAEASRVRHQLVTAKIDAEKLTDGTYAQAAGRTLGADAVLIGSVSEYGYQHGLREEPVVGLNARLVRASDGVVLWASSQSEAGRGLFSRESVNNVAQRVVIRMVDSLRDAVDSGMAAKAPAAP
jgi:polysaccharide biosynthesis protein PelC